MTSNGRWWAFMLSMVGILLALVCAPVSHAVQVSARVDRNQMALGDTLTYSIVVSSEDSVSVSEPSLPPLEGFELLNAWTSSESRSLFANGVFQVEQIKNFNYMLAPLKPGELRIDPASINVNGQVKQTNSINIKVLPQGQAPPSQGRRGGVPPHSDDGSQDPLSQMEDMFNQLLRRRSPPGFRTQPIDPDEAFFIQAEVDKKRVYVGEQVTASWYLYARGQIHDIDTLRYPSLSGFWKEEIELATRLNFQPEVVNGVMYQKALLVSYALFPIRPGAVKVDEYQAKCTFSVGGPFGAGRPAVATKKSQAIEIQVDEIPQEGRPSEFTGAVGEFAVQSTATQNVVPAHQPLQIKVRFSGRGNAKLIDLPKLQLPEKWEVYDVKPDAKFFRDGTSYKEFLVTVVPRVAGDAEFPSIKMSVFNPGKKQFEEIQSSPLTIQVLPGVEPQGVPSALADPTQSAKPQGPLLPDVIREWQSQAQILDPRVFWGGMVALVFGLLFGRAAYVFGWFQREKSLSSQVAKKVAYASSLAKRGDWRKVGSEGINLIYFVLGELSTTTHFQGDLDALLLHVPPSVRRDLGESFRKTLRTFELLSFAPEEMVGTLKNKDSLAKAVSELDILLQKAISRGQADESDETKPQP